jgi:catechol 2,3-dioxygenase-like lactoylglutathione lyase family enzyme
MNLEVVTVPVSDVVRAKRFYKGLGRPRAATWPK